MWLNVSEKVGLHTAQGKVMEVRAGKYVCRIGPSLSEWESH